MAANKLYTLQDLKNAAKKGKTVISFQYIEGRDAINECAGNPEILLNYLANAFAGIMVRSKLNTTPEKLIEDVGKITLGIYQTQKKRLEEIEAENIKES